MNCDEHVMRTRLVALAHSSPPETPPYADMDLQDRFDTVCDALVATVYSEHARAIQTTCDRYVDVENQKAKCELSEVKTYVYTRLMGEDTKSRHTCGIWNKHQNTRRLSAWCLLCRWAHRDCHRGCGVSSPSSTPAAAVWEDIERRCQDAVASTLLFDPDHLAELHAVVRPAIDKACCAAMHALLFTADLPNDLVQEVLTRYGVLYSEVPKIHPMGEYRKFRQDVTSWLTEIVLKNVPGTRIKFSPSWGIGRGLMQLVAYGAQPIFIT